MNTVTVYRRPTGEVAGFRAEGHANFRAVRSRDIVCSAVSALTQTAVNAMETVAGVPVEPTLGDGLLELLLPGGLTAKQASACQIILRTVLQGLADIAETYPAQVRIRYEEWREKHA